MTLAQAFTLSIAALGLVLYHFSQKLVPAAAAPLQVLLYAYLIAAGICALGLLVAPGTRGIAELFVRPHWTSVLMAVAVVLIELGWLLAYRAGWAIGRASIVCNLTVSLLLIPAGYVVFKERLTTAQLAGVALSGVGLYLMAWR